MKRREFLKCILAGATVVAASRMLAGISRTPECTTELFNDGKWHKIEWHKKGGIIQFRFDRIHMIPKDEMIDKCYSLFNQYAHKDGITCSIYVKLPTDSPHENPDGTIVKYSKGDLVIWGAQAEHIQEPGTNYFFNSETMGN